LHDPIPRPSYDGAPSINDGKPPRLAQSEHPERISEA
jgi:hypothetical protein